MASFILQTFYPSKREQEVSTPLSRCCHYGDKTEKNNICQILKHVWRKTTQTKSMGPVGVGFLHLECVEAVNEHKLSRRALFSPTNWGSMSRRGMNE